MIDLIKLYSIVIECERGRNIAFQKKLEKTHQERSCNNSVEPLEKLSDCSKIGSPAMDT